MRHRTLAEMEVIAREATKAALQDYIIPDIVRQNLVLGILSDGDYGIFEL